MEFCLCILKYDVCERDSSVCFVIRCCISCTCGKMALNKPRNERPSLH
jgi:hypothetical protein